MDAFYGCVAGLPFSVDSGACGEGQRPLHGDSKSKRHASMEAQLLLQHRELVTDTCASRLKGMYAV
jgi:hypothetical protein